MTNLPEHYVERKCEPLIFLEVVCGRCSTVGKTRVSTEVVDGLGEVLVYHERSLYGWSISKYGIYCPACVARQAREVLIQLNV